MISPKALYAKFNTLNKYATHELLDYFIDDVLGSLGRKIPRPAPDDLHEWLYDTGATYAKLVRENEPFFDILGPLYMELGSSGQRQWLGQFFTPQHIAQCMAAITGFDTLPEGDRLITCCDPTCGSGVMLLSAAQEMMRLHGVDTLNRLSLTGNDLDSYCARMCAAQLLGNCLVHEITLGEIVVYRGNSLMPDDDLDVVVHATSPTAPPVSSAMSTERKQALVAVARQQLDTQFDLFGNKEDAA